MKTFRELYCAACRCRDEEFSRRLFWRCLHRHAVPLAPALLVARPEFFDADRAFIEQAGRARSMRELREEIHDFVIDSRNRSWWRRRAHVRVSAHRLSALARIFLASNSTPVRALRLPRAAEEK